MDIGDDGQLMSRLRSWERSNGNMTAFRAGAGAGTRHGLRHRHARPPTKCIWRCRRFVRKNGSYAVKLQGLVPRPSTCCARTSRTELTPNGRRRKAVGGSRSTICSASTRATPKSSGRAISSENPSFSWSARGLLREAHPDARGRAHEAARQTHHAASSTRRSGGLICIIL